jgi:hypothetical protein
MNSKLKLWFKGLSTAGKIGVVAGSSFLGLAAAGSQIQPPACTNSISYSTKTQTISFNDTKVDDNSLAKGQTKVTTAGVEGEKELKHKSTNYSPSGCKTNTYEVMSETVTKEPVDQVTAVGTYVAPAVEAPVQTQPSCPDGTYVNSAGNTVCSPYSSPSAPAGATAQCVDGTYSFSQSRRGTCSHHGGVAQWL